jgi:hypothetical protein
MKTGERDTPRFAGVEVHRLQIEDGEKVRKLASLRTASFPMPRCYQDAARRRFRAHRPSRRAPKRIT